MIHVHQHSLAGKKRGGDAPILARQFDGFNDFMALDQAYSWGNPGVKYDVILDSPPDTYHHLGGLASDLSDSRILTGDDNYRFFIGTSSNDGVEIFTPGIRTTIEITHASEISGSTFLISSSNPNNNYQLSYPGVVREIDRVGNDNDRFWLKGIMISFTIGGLEFNEANNWRGATLNGPALVQI